MKIYVWRHNKTYHSYSMISEPCILNEFYLDAIAIVAANNLEDALRKLAEENKGWRLDDLRKLEYKVYTMDVAKVIFTEIRGSIEHL